MTPPVTPPRRSRRHVFLALGGVGLLGIAVAAFFLLRKPVDKPKSDPLAATEANARGIGQMEQFNYSDPLKPTDAVREFTEAVRLAPDWLPARINLGMALYNSAAAVDDPVLSKAIALFEGVLKDDSDNPYAHFNLGIIHLYRAKFESAQMHFRKVLDRDPTDDRAWLYLAQSYPNYLIDDEPKKYLQKAVDLNPYLVPAWSGLAYHDSTNDADRLAMIQRMEDLRKSNWEDEARATKHSEQGRYATCIGTGLAKPADIGPMPMFEQQSTWADAPGVEWDLGARDGSTILDGLLSKMRTRFGGTMIRFDFDGDEKPDLLVLSAVYRDGKLGDVLLRNTGTGFEDVSVAAGLGNIGSLAGAVADFDNDGRPDLALSGPNGMRLLRNADGKTFEDKTAAAGFDKSTGIFFALSWLDIDQDGDLDLIAGRYADNSKEAVDALNGKKPGGTGKVVVLQNSGVAPPSNMNEPTPPLTIAFKPIEVPALSVPGPVSGLVATDIDGDKDVDLVVLIDGRQPVVVLNDRLMRFSLGQPLPTTATDLVSGVILDSNGDDQSDLLLLAPGKPAFLVSAKALPDANLAKRFAAGATDAPALVSAQRCDLDLDGRSDIVGLAKDGKGLFLQGDGEGKLANRSEPFGPAVAKLIGLKAVATMDANGDGTPDFIAWTVDGVKVFLGQSNGNQGLKLAFTGVRDNNNAGSGQKNLRTNTSGIGIKCRTVTGPLLSMVELTTLSAGPGQSLLPIDIGLGRRTQTDAVRLRWPDCVVQAELATPAGAVVTIREINRKPTSCPVLMTWDGEKWIYITDFLGGGALGESGSDGSVRPPRPEESVKIEAHQLGLKNGKYVVRIAEPMDEVMYLDGIRLAVVDHPADAIVYPDERFAVAEPLPTQRILAFRKRIAPTMARDHRGVDQTKTILDRDGKTVSGFAKRSWLGFAEEHWLEFDFGDRVKDFPKAPRYLVLAGWTDYPYPESILAAEQAGIAMLPPVFERKKTDGTWEKIADIGFPAGLPKVMTVPVGDSAGPFRLRTNLQIHWDQLFLGAAEDLALTTELKPLRAALSHPGCVQEISTNGKPPQAYDPVRFETVATTNWKGYLTKLGDVTELLSGVDDRFAICGPGDEVLLEFDPALLQPLKAGWVRSFVLRTHGYCKDTAPTTQSGGDVNPLPFRGMKSYPHREAGPKSHADDLRLWHTRPAGPR